MELSRSNPRLKQAVVSVRLDPSLIDRLDALAARTKRSRGFYVRMAIEELLPMIEANFWSDSVEKRISREDQRFADIMRRLNDELTLDDEDDDL